MNSLLKEVNRCLRDLHALMPLWEAALSAHFRELRLFRRHHRRLQRWTQLSSSSSSRLPPGFFEPTHRLCGHKLRAGLLVSADRVRALFDGQVAPLSSRVEAAVDRVSDRLAKNSHLLGRQDLFEGPLPAADLVARLVALQNHVALEKLRCAADQKALLRPEGGPKPQAPAPESCATWRLLCFFLKGYKEADEACPYELPVTAAAEQ